MTCTCKRKEFCWTNRGCFESKSKNWFHIVIYARSWQRTTKYIVVFPFLKYINSKPPTAKTITALNNNLKFFLSATPINRLLMTTQCTWSCFCYSYIFTFSHYSTNIMRIKNCFQYVFNIISISSFSFFLFVLHIQTPNLSNSTVRCYIDTTFHLEKGPWNGHDEPTRLYGPNNATDPGKGKTWVWLIGC